MNLKQTMCDEYCRFPHQETEDSIKTICEQCPLNDVKEYILEQSSTDHLGRHRYDGIEKHECIDLDALKFLLDIALGD